MTDSQRTEVELPLAAAQGDQLDAERRAAGPVRDFRAGMSPMDRVFLGVVVLVSVFVIAALWLFG
ncbi:MAG: hypothetical protein ABI559_13130 [Chloroflexota bacterium]